MSDKWISLGTAMCDLFEKIASDGALRAEYAKAGLEWHDGASWVELIMKGKG